MTVDVRSLDQDVRHVRTVDPQQALIAAVDALAHKVDGSVPPGPPSAFRHSVDALVDTIDALAHRPADEPERGLDRAADVLADTIRHVVHERPSASADHAPLLDALARPM